MLSLLVWALAIPAMAEPLDGREAGRRMMHYYEQPDPRAAIAWLPAMDSAAFANAGAVDIFAAFYLHVVKADPSLAGTLADAALAAPAPAALAAALAIWMADHPEKNALVQRLADAGGLGANGMERLQGIQPFSKDTFAVHSPHDIDILWAAFFATGDTDYVAFVAQFLPYLLSKERMGELARADDDESRKAFELSLLAGTAAGSLSSLAREHPRVQQTLEAMARDWPKPVSSAVAALLESRGGR